MHRTLKLASQITAVVAVATLVGPSAFADFRHSNGTRGGGGHIERGSGGNSGGGGRSQSQPSTQPAPRAERGGSIGRGSWDNEGRNHDQVNRDRSGDRGDHNRGDDHNTTRIQRDDRDRSGVRDNETRASGRRDWYSDDRYRTDWRRDHPGRYNGGAHRYGTQPFYTYGRVTRYAPWNNGYRVWISGCDYPFYVPINYWHRYPFRVGLYLRLGGWYNPLGYYDYYYDDYDYSYRGDVRADSRATLRGVVESVDYRRGTFVLKNDATGDFITVICRTNGGRVDEMRAGDYISINGDWRRSGSFDAYNIDLLENVDTYGRR